MSSRSKLGIAVAVLSLLAQPAFAAQCYLSWNCNGVGQCAQVYGANKGSRAVDSCSGFQPRDTVSWCRCDGVAIADEPRFISPEAAVLSAHAVGALAGLLLGSFSQSPNGQSFYAEGAGEGAAVLGLAVLAVNAEHFSKPAVVAISMLDGAAAGISYGHYRAVALVPQGTTPTDEVKQSLTGGAIGAGITGLVSFSLLTLSSSDKQRTIPAIRFEATPRYMGLRCSW